MSHHVLPAGLGAMRQAREHVREQVGDALGPSAVADARLLTSELVANAIQHGQLGERDRVTLDIHVSVRTVRVEVVDAGPGFDDARREARHEGRGWGLVFVDRLSDRWGVHEAHPHGVWFELDR